MVESGLTEITDSTRVVVAMSGGVDSSVVAALLKDRGYNVTGVTMKTWTGPSSSHGGRKHGCYGPGEQQDIEDAERVASILGIPLHVIDLSSEYRADVLDHFRSECSLGRTPNPCSRCNPRIKFGSLLSKVRDKGVRFDCFATGHYARIGLSEDKKRHLLKKARDIGKDQSYFLALLSQEQLGLSMFPLGEYLKSEVRQLADRFGLPVAEKQDSQDFIDDDYDEVRPPPDPGPIMDRRGNRLGVHKGLAYHTIGQRRGLGIAAGTPLYVTALDPVSNTVIVGSIDDVYSDSLIASDPNWIAIESPDAPLRVKAKIRSRSKEADALVIPMGVDRAYVEFSEPQLAVTPGQTIVFYDGDIVVGGGVIEKTEEKLANGENIGCLPER